MATLFRLLLSITVLFSVGVTIQAQSQPPLPATVELDLIFPRHNVTYKPVYPFPIVFVVRNAAVAWPYTFEFSWHLRSPWQNRTADDVGDYHTFGIGGFDPIQTTPDPNGQVPAPPDTLLVINSTRLIINSTNSEYLLSYSFGIRGNCTPGNEEGPIEPGTFFHNNIIEFNTSADGEIPDILGAGSCPSLLGTIEVVDNSTFFGELCPVLSDPAPKGHPCDFTIDEKVASSVASEMLATADCTTGSWPDPTGLVDQCRSMAPGLRSRPIGMVLIVFVVGEVVFLLV